MTEFDAATAGVRVADDVWDVDVSPDWFVFTGPNGGYLASLLLRALVLRLADPERMARSLTVHYLRPPSSGPAVVRTSVVRVGRSLATLTGTLEQEGVPVALAVAAFSRARPSLSFCDLSMPAVPGVSVADRPAVPVELLPPIARRFEYRPVTPQTLFAGGDRAEMTTWLRLAEPRPVDPVLLATIADAAPPAIFYKAASPVVATTIDLTVHFRADSSVPPGDGWCLAAFRSCVGVDGFVEEDGEVWSEDGRLLAQSRQLSLVVPIT
jgi:acyl-CoA thioesterase